MLGPFAEPVRYVAESTDGEDAGLEVFTPFQKWRVPTNWKVPAFTSSRDPEHGAMTHRSVNAAAIGPMRGMGDDGSRHRQRKPLPRDIYVAGDHNSGTGAEAAFSRIEVRQSLENIVALCRPR